ncbi:MAG: hypothetical protein II021_00395 [Oscillospiraceae bacterium]|nr:hypothetical protein [Oscillospiraceae bacterium]
MSRGLLKHLQHGVLRLEAHRVRVADDVNASFRLVRQNEGAGSDGAHLADFDLLRVRLPLDENEVGMHTASDLFAVPAPSAWGGAALAERGLGYEERRLVPVLRAAAADYIGVEKPLAGYLRAYKLTCVRFPRLPYYL